MSKLSFDELRPPEPMQPSARPRLKRSRSAPTFAVTSSPAAPCPAPSSSWERFRMAVAYLRYSARCVDAQVEARCAKRGERQDDFVSLADWRHHQGPSQ
jgi:hypothetical protein